MPRIGWLFVSLLTLGLMLAGLFALRRLAALLARWFADRIERGRDGARQWFIVPPPIINPAHLLLGLVLLGFLLYAIVRYLPS